MAITSFKIEKVKAVDRAECSSIPKVMVIAGPNGVGKSTLLYEISQERGVQTTGKTKFLYQPPHRAIRRTRVQRRWLGGAMKLVSDLLSLRDVSGFEGLPIQNQPRTPDNVDEAGSTIKYTLGKIENKRQTVLAELVDQSRADGQIIDTSKIPDIYSPLRELTKYLLPHLIFDRVDFKNEDDIKCIWRRKDIQDNLELDIDDLSSGEKSIILLFLPLLENDINQYLNSIGKTKDPQNVINLPKLPDRVFIIDEPEQHLHPDLQAKILTYIRNRANSSNIQFIIATHSPTILDQALDEELYLFSPRGKVLQENQLKRVASNIERLEALKQLAGNTYLVTTGRSIVCIEGDANATTEPTDIRLLEILYPRSTAYTFIPTGGKGNVIKTVQQLREYLPEESFKIKIYGLTDKDQTESDIPGVFTLPVCMIENLLLVEEAIYEYFTSIGVTEATNSKAVKDEIMKVISELKEDEIRIRVEKRIGAHVVRISGTTENDIKASHEKEIDKVKKLLPPDDDRGRIIQASRNEVEEIISNGEALYRFRGKTILKKIYQKFVQPKNIPYAKFCYELAERVANSKRVEDILNPLFDKLDNAELATNRN